MDFIMMNDDDRNVAASWEGPLEKAGKSMIGMGAWRQRWCMIDQQGQFRYWEDHTKTNFLGSVPLEKACWEFEAGSGSGKGSYGQMSIRTVGRADKAGEEGGRAFHFRFLPETNRESVCGALARAHYLRNRDVFLEACANGDAHTVLQVLAKMRQQESLSGGASVGRRLLAPAPAVRALQPVVFCSDYDPVSTTGNRESYFDAASGGGGGGGGGDFDADDASPMDLLLHEADADGNSCLHLAVLSANRPPWRNNQPRSDPAAAASDGAAAAAASSTAAADGDGSDGAGGAGAGAGAGAAGSLSHLRGFGPHPIATLRVLLCPPPLPASKGAKGKGGGGSGEDVDVVAATGLQEMARARVPAVVARSTSAFLLECITKTGETPLQSALSVAPFRVGEQRK
jgi:hypothetical protein